MKKVPLYNPMLHDFSCEWLDDTNTAHTLVMPAREITYFEEPIARFMTKHLADAVLEDRGGIKTNWEDDIKAIKKEILI